jgi:hypothetical protein
MILIMIININKNLLENLNILKKNKINKWLSFFNKQKIKN